MTALTNNFWRCMAMVLLLLPAAAFAQQTTSSLRVDTLNASGAPLPNVSVTLVDTRTGTTRTNTSGASGNVIFSGLRVGGPYTVTASAPGFGQQTITDISVRLGDTFVLPVAMSSTVLEEVVVTAQAVRTTQVAMGPSSAFGFDQLQDNPAINRDIRDIIRADPRIYQDVGDVGAIQCAGANPRFNSLTVDGVRLNDNFGLNRNGFPTERQPFPFDSLQQVSVELAPFDVQYGGFTACNINAVTRSGENEIHGSIFYDYTNDSMRGDELEGDDIDLGDFSETRYGFSVGGPIIKDKLFFFVSYEKLEGANLFSFGPAGSGAANEIPGVSIAQAEQIADIARNLYGYEPGFFPSSLDNEDEKYTIKIDWNINDFHRAALTYNYNDGFNNTRSDDDDDELEFSGHFYERGAELNATTAALFSDWTDNFSTEARVSYSELDARVEPLGGLTLGEFQVQTWNDPDGDGFFDSAIVYFGADDSRHANDLNYETWNYKLAGAYQFDNHRLTFGYELDDLDIFNLFIQHVFTQNNFDRSCGGPDNPNGCIDALIAGTPRQAYYGNAGGTNNPIDGAAAFGYQIHTVYLQDEFFLFDGDVEVVAGLRYDWYSSDDLPRENPAFIERQGYSNAENFDGEDLLQPRLGLTWNLTDTVRLRGGAGLFSGGNPNVWLSNNYQNDGITTIQVNDRSGRSLFTTPLGPNGDGRPGFDPYQDFYEAVANGTANTGVNAIDPGFKIPSVWKYNLGVTWDFMDYYQVVADVLYSESDDSAIVINGTAEQVGTAPDGRPIYNDSRRFNSDYILTNVTGPDASSLVLSAGIFARYDNGFDWSFGYAYTDSEEVSPMTSSVAFSNFANIAVRDFNRPDLATANYEIPHRFTLTAGYEKYQWGDLRSKITVFASVQEGRPFSYTFSNDDGDFFGDFADNRHLLYVPTGLNDPNVVFEPGFDTDRFFDLVNSSGLAAYAGGIAPRNAFNSGWWGTMDIRFEQEFPAFRSDHRFAGFIVVRNFCNLMNDEWCTFKEVGFPRMESVVDMRIEDGRYVYEAFESTPGQQRIVDQSLYEIRVGVNYQF